MSKHLGVKFLEAELQKKKEPISKIIAKIIASLNRVRPNREHFFLVESVRQEISNNSFNLTNPERNQILMQDLQ